MAANSRLGRCPARLAPIHFSPINHILERGGRGANNNTEANTKKSEPAFAWAEVPVVLEDDGEGVEKRVKRSVDDGHVKR